MTTERVEEIRRQRGECKRQPGPIAEVWTGYDVDCLLAALAQAERERRGCEGALADAATVPTDDVEAGIRALIGERDAARAEVERLTEDRDRWHKAWEERRAYAQTMVTEVERLKGLADYPLTPTGSKLLEQAEVALARVRAALDREHICVMEACCNDAVRAALEGRG